MRVLKDQVLVIVSLEGKETSGLVADSAKKRKGTVAITGSEQIHVNEEVLFGDQFEELDIETSRTRKYYLMHETNVKIVFDDPRNPEPSGNILNFNKVGA